MRSRLRRTEPIVGHVILRAKDDSVPETNAAVFRQLADTGVLDDEAGRRMAEAAGFRNILAHQYGSGLTSFSA